MIGAFDGRALLILVVIAAAAFWWSLGAPRGGAVDRGKHGRSTQGNTDGAGVANRGREVG